MLSIFKEYYFYNTTDTQQQQQQTDRVTYRDASHQKTAKNCRKKLLSVALVYPVDIDTSTTRLALGLRTGLVSGWSNITCLFKPSQACVAGLWLMDDVTVFSWNKKWHQM